MDSNSEIGLQELNPGSNAVKSTYSGYENRSMVFVSPFWVDKLVPDDVLATLLGCSTASLMSQHHEERR